MSLCLPRPKKIIVLIELVAFYKKATFCKFDFKSGTTILEGRTLKNQWVSFPPSPENMCMIFIYNLTNSKGQSINYKKKIVCAWLLLIKGAVHEYFKTSQ